MSTQRVPIEQLTDDEIERIAADQEVKGASDPPEPLSREVIAGRLGLRTSALVAFVHKQGIVPTRRALGGKPFYDVAVVSAAVEAERGWFEERAARSEREQAVAEARCKVRAQAAPETAQRADATQRRQHAGIDGPLHQACVARLPADTVRELETDALRRVADRETQAAQRRAAKRALAAVPPLPPTPTIELPTGRREVEVYVPSSPQPGPASGAVKQDGRCARART